MPAKRKAEQQEQERWLAKDGCKLYAVSHKNKKELKVSSIVCTCNKDVCCTLETDHAGQCKIEWVKMKEDQLVKIESTFAVVNNEGMEWTLTDGKKILIRTNPFNTHRGDYRLGELHGYQAPNIPSFLSKVFDLSKATTLTNVYEGKTGYITFSSSSNLVIGRCKSGRSFLRVKCGTGFLTFQQRYASYAPSRYDNENLWVWNSNSDSDFSSLREIMKENVVDMDMDDSKQAAFLQEMRRLADPSTVLA